VLKVRHVMVKQVITAREEIALQEAIEILYKKHIGSVVILDDEKKCVGIFTERDAIRVTAQKIPSATPLKEVMTRNVVTIGEDASLEEARRLIVERGIRHLPVVDQKGKLVGLFAVRGFLDEIFVKSSS
jgi:CBS domain-containing protein